MREYWGMRDAQPLVLSLLYKAENEGKILRCSWVIDWLGRKLRIKRPSAESYMDDILSAGFILTDRENVFLSDLGKEEMRKMKKDGWTFE